MNNTRTNNTIYSIATGIIYRIVSILAGFLSQYFYLHILGVEYLSLDGLFTSVLGFLSLAELGFSTAITAKLYKPLIDDDKNKISSLMYIYKISYICVGVFILVTGLIFLPFLKYIINFENQPQINLYFVYVLFLLNTCIPYLFFSYKGTIITADQKSYLIDKYNIIFEILISVTKCIILFLTKDAVVAILSEIIIRFVYYYYIARQADKLYPYIYKLNNNSFDKSLLKSLVSDIKYIFVINLFSKITNVSNSIIVSKVLGTIIIGHTYMYDKIINQTTAFVNTFTTSFIGSIGNLVNSKNDNESFEIYKQLNLVNYWICCFACVSLLCLLNPFLKMYYGNYDELGISLMKFEVLIAMVLSFYFNTISNISDSYKKAYGILSQGWQISIIGCVLCIIINVFLVRRFGIFGIYLTTLIYRYFTSYLPKTILLFKHGFKSISVNYLAHNIYRFVLLMAICLLSYLICSKIIDRGILSFIEKCVVCIFVPNIILFFVYRKKKEFKLLVNRVSTIFAKDKYEI